MSNNWTQHNWQLTGERTTLGEIAFDSTIHCGVGQDFRQVGSDRYRFRARAGLAPYSWRFHFRIDSPGDGREVTLEVADFNHFGQELWQETATVVSRDGEEWGDLGAENVHLVPWTPTGRAAEDASLDDGWHPAYGVRHRLRLDAPKLWFASPTPYTLAHSRDHQQALARRCDFFSVEEIGRTHHFREHGFPVLMTKAAKPGRDDDRLRILVVAGEHPAESAGLYACEGLLEEILRQLDLLSDFSFWVVPVVNVDGVAFGRTYHNVDPADPLAPGINLARDWGSRTQPETQAVWRLLEEVRPHCAVSLHNGRHRREFEVWAPPQPHLAPLMRRLREPLPLPLQHWKPPTEAGQFAPEAMNAELAKAALLVETLLLRKLPECKTFKESYRRTGVLLLRGLVAGLREAYRKPQMRALAEPLGEGPLRLKASDFVAQLPSFFYDADCSSLRKHSVYNFEVNGLPLKPGHYDAWLRMRPRHDMLQVLDADGNAEAVQARDGWSLLSSRHVPARKLCFEFETTARELPFDEVLLAPEGTPVDVAQGQATPFDRYVRDTCAGERAHFAHWSAFHSQLMRAGFGADDLDALFERLVEWIASRQVHDFDAPHYGAVHSEEDKYDARDAAAAAACFTRQHWLTNDLHWLDRARTARQYVYCNQVREPGNLPRHGGFVHMVHGTWGTRFTRLEPPFPGVDGVDTCAVIHQLCRAADLGPPLGEQDREVLRLAAEWVANNEALPGVFLHHEGATHDCQNMNALGLSALVRAHHTLAAAGGDPPAAWLEAAKRGIRHYLDGQESIGVWPYLFAHVGERGQAFHFANIPDHGIGLVHLTRVCDKPPLSDLPELHEALKRAARWYLGVCRVDGDTIDLDYDRRPDLGNNLCFSGFTWCRFTAAATLIRIARLTEEVEPWRHLALRLMEHVRQKLWQTDDPDRAPVVAHARPEAKLATWRQAAEWDASMLGEMIEDLRLMEG